MDADRWIYVAIGAAVLIALVAWLVVRNRRTHSLRDRFGAEYERAVTEEGNRRSGESELSDRLRRREALNIRPLAPESADRFAGEWDRVQGSFVDSPDTALRDADKLITTVMQERGYPMMTSISDPPTSPSTIPMSSTNTGRRTGSHWRTIRARRRPRTSEKPWCTFAPSSIGCSNATRRRGTRRSQDERSRRDDNHRTPIRLGHVGRSASTGGPGTHHGVAIRGRRSRRSPAEMARHRGAVR
jgi:hypothetical protein